MVVMMLCGDEVIFTEVNKRQTRVFFTFQCRVLSSE